MFKTASIVILAIAASGCATVTKGTEDTLQLQSEPPGAQATALYNTGDMRLGPYSCETPCELELNRKREWCITFEMEDHKAVAAHVDPRISSDGAAGMAGNVLIGGVIGMGVDAATGASADLMPNPVKAVMAQDGSPDPSYILYADRFWENREMPVSECAANYDEARTKSTSAADAELADEPIVANDAIIGEDMDDNVAK